MLDLERLIVGRDEDEEDVGFGVTMGVGMDRLTVLLGFEARAYLSPPGVEKKSIFGVWWML